MDALLNTFTGFHWMRPLWLLALIPAALLLLLLWRRARQARQWQHLISPELLRPLTEAPATGRRRPWLWGLALAWLMAIVALAGPSWEQRAMPVHKSENGLVIVLDLSPSMLAEDLTPSRLVRARMKITDVLRQREDGFTALVAYADDAHVVSPLTDDTATIQSLLEALHPDIMPVPGSRPEAAIDKAKALFEDAGLSNGQILLLTDGMVNEAADSVLEQLQDTDYRLSILGVGTPDGAPIPAEGGHFERERNGDIVVAKLRENRLERAAGRTGGRYQRIGTSTDDVQWLLEQPSPGEDRQRQVEREFDTWYDRGPWLALLLLPLILYSFRRGLLTLVVALPLFTALPQPAHANDWLAPWLTPDQRGARALSQEDPEAAAETFENPEWRGTALYRAEEYEAAAEAFAQSDNARAHYNRGNALARGGDLEKALEAYDQALERDPELADAQQNRARVEQVLEQQRQQQNQRDGDGQEGDGEEEQGQDGQSREGQDQQEGDPNGDSRQGGEQGQNSGQQSGSQNREDPQDRRNESDSAGRDGEQTNPGATEDEQDPADGTAGQGDRGAQDETTNEPSPSDESGSPGEDERDPSDSAAAADADETGNEDDQTAALGAEGDLSDEERQSMEQWLRRVPDDPGGLLRRKFEYQSRQQRMDRLRGQTPAPDEEERW